MFGVAHSVFVKVQKYVCASWVTCRVLEFEIWIQKETKYNHSSCVILMLKNEVKQKKI